MMIHKENSNSNKTIIHFSHKKCENNNKAKPERKTLKRKSSHHFQEQRHETDIDPKWNTQNN